MDEETRAAFGRIDRWFELSQQQHMELSSRMERGFADVNGQLEAQREILDGHTEQLNGIRTELRVHRTILERHDEQFDGMR
jgi:hypothetical protein